MGLPRSRRSSKRDADMRRFAYPHRMMMMLSDGKHFRAGPARTRRVALFFIDDATRYTPPAVVGPSESTELFLRGFYEVIRCVGLMDILFLDGGPGFVSGDTIAVCARLGVLLIHGTAEYPEGHGKIERFHQTAWQDILRALTSPGVGDDFASLELRLNHYLATQYNLRAHESLDQDSPSTRWENDTRELRFYADDAELRERFVITESRSVSTDNVVRVEGTFYEVPRGHRGTSIQVFRQTLDQTVSIIHDGKRVRLHPVDLEANARAHRARPDSAPEKESAPPPRTAAQIAFDRDFGPVVAPDGGYVPPTKTKE
jgi:transposase InsO family protein